MELTLRQKIGWRLMGINAPYIENRKSWDWRGSVRSLGTYLYHGYIV